ncbi:MAG: methyltransferase domain-containing protein [Planctomycetes bacterium]|nr:methyltransferase domain-containing protein [Planctomycetota bacterium]
MPRAASQPNRRRAPSRPGAAEPFDADYYRRFYGDPQTRVSDAAAVRKLATFVASYLRYLELPVRTILDVGCGMGHWRTAAAELWPRARWFGVEYSVHLCERFGWTQGSIVDLDVRAATGRTGFDLVVCQGVLQYLDDAAAAKAIGNLGRWCTGALYLEALTAADWRVNCDRTRTDGAVHLRRGAWYRTRLQRHFRSCGGGVFASRRTGVTLFELEGA